MPVNRPSGLTTKWDTRMLVAGGPQCLTGIGSESSPFSLNTSAPVKLSHHSPPISPPPPPLFSWPSRSPLEPLPHLSIYGGQGEASWGLDEETLPPCGDRNTEWDSLVGMDRGSHDVSTLTELCSGGDSEVEIVSLLSEGLPNYTLRADCMFGYDHDDWLHTPLLPPEATLGLTHDQIEETFNYFLLCSERVGQVTKTYHDIEAVTHLLEEKERDLELAARIGQSLLKQNRKLTARNELLDEQLVIAKEEISQLRHELSMRDDLLHLYASSEEIENASESYSPMKRNESSNSLGNFVHYDFIHQKLKGLEEENLKLRCVANDLTSETTNYEEQEQELMMVCVQELSSVNKHVADLSDELARKVEDSLRQQEEISSLLGQIVDLQARCKGLTVDNEELAQHLNASRENQSQLRLELKDLQDKYSESEDMLQEAREDIKNLRNKSVPNSTVQRYSALSAVFPMDSLAAEIEGTFRKGLDSPAPSEYKNHPWRVFETVKVANKSARLRSRCPSPGPVPGSSPVSSRTSTPRTSYYGSDSASVTLDDKPPSGSVKLADVANLDDNKRGTGQKRLGQPGMPGGQDLEAALRCLSDRQRSHVSERPFFEVERERKLRALTAASQGASDEGEDVVELSSSGFLTPNDSSLESTGTNYSNGSSAHSSAGSRSYLPDRLQIVKPLEGSMTLHHWQQLAKPNLGGILQPRPGVITKDFRELEIDMQHVYSLNDLEEDEPDLSQFPAGLSPGAHGTMVTPPSSGLHLPQTPPTHTVSTCRRHHPFLLLPISSSGRKRWSKWAY
ncbi:hypothetical protein DPEC_G00175080 [Dallia pectoralis]|uniref:Uncharacterized protein n=1 Tax=Dallia pectoralis TaxID=75939 RepID=A0ACC2GEF1_DALPE|nr:hypothetical protein DPEC_G00175080 [Dallia pectoralis]